MPMGQSPKPKRKNRAKPVKKQTIDYTAYPAVYDACQRNIAAIMERSFKRSCSLTGITVS